MSLNHVSDKKLQAYIDGLPLDQRQAIEEHLARCPVCSAQLKAYQFIDSEMKTEPDVLFSGDFDNRIIQKISVLEKRRYQLPRLLVRLILGITALGMITYYFLQGKTRTTLENVGSTVWTHLKSAPDTIGHFTRESGTSIQIILFAAIILLVFALLDRFFSSSRHRRTPWMNRYLFITL